MNRIRKCFIRVVFSVRVLFCGIIFLAFSHVRVSNQGSEAVTPLPNGSKKKQTQKKQKEREESGDGH